MKATSEENQLTTSVVDEIGKINFVGNIIPHTWYQSKLLRHESGKINDVAVTLLGDIIYWYRPTVVRDEDTGQVIAIKKKFAGNKLQKSYQSWGAYFGYTKRQVQDAVAFLKKRGLIQVEYRTVVTGAGQRISNVIFLEPIVEMIRKITFPQETVFLQEETNVVQQPDKPSDKKSLIRGITLERDRYHVETGEVSRSNVGGVAPESDRYHVETGDGITLERETYTKNTLTDIPTETSTNTLSLSGSNGNEKKIGERERTKSLVSGNPEKQKGNSRHDLVTCLEYVEHLAKEGNPIQSPRGLAKQLWREGADDLFIEKWLVKKQQSTTANGSALSAEEYKEILRFCPQCLGSKMEIIKGKGAKTCTHTELTVDVLQDYVEAGDLDERIFNHYRETI